MHELQTTVLVAFHPGLKIKVPQYTATRYKLITTEQRGNLFYFIFNTIECNRSI